MGADQNLDWAAAIASALEWWDEAGVGMLVEDTPRDWLAPPAPPAPSPAARPGSGSAPGAAGAHAAPDMLPDTLEAFLAWRTGAQAPEAGWPGLRIAAGGGVDAKLMVVVDCPERDDRDRLLGGPAGVLFDRMLAAIGCSRETVLLASVCAARPTAGRIPRDIEARLGEIARHHVALTGAKWLLVLGDAASRAVLGTDLREARGRLRALNHRTGTSTQVVASFHPRFLLERPACKADAWRDLQVLIRGMTS